MAVLAKRATLFSHLAVIVLTPLAVVIARKWILGILVVIMTAVSIPLIAAGRFDWQSIPEGAKQLLIGVALLMALAALMTTADHFRFAGWTLDGPRAAEEAATGFAQAVVAGDVARSRSYCSAERLENSEELARWIQTLRKDLGDSLRTVSEADLGTSDYSIFQQIIPQLAAIHRRGQVYPSTVAVTVLAVPEQLPAVGAPLSAIQLVLQREGGTYCVSEGEVISVNRPEQLR